MEDLKFQDHYFNIDENTTEAYMDFEDGRKYFALIKKNDGMNYLSMVIKHGGVKQGQERKWPF